MSYRTFITATLMSALTLGIATAGQITIADPSFENSALAAPSPAPADPNRTTTFPCVGLGTGCGWVKTDPGGDSVGVIRPRSGGTQSTSIQQGFTQYPDTTTPLGSQPPLGSVYPNGVPDGVNFAYITSGYFHQVLIDTIQPNTVYTLQAFFGARWDFDSVHVGAFNYTGNQGFMMELGAFNSYNAPTANLSANTLGCVYGYTSYNSFFFPDPNCPHVNLPITGEWLPYSTTYTSGGLNDPNVGKQLVIIFGAPGPYADFDMVTLNATPLAAGAPEPATIAMMLSGLALVGFKLRRK